MPALAKKTEGVTLKMSGDPSAGGGTTTSALGHKRTYAVPKNMSALPPKADMCSAGFRNVFVPIAGRLGLEPSNLAFYHCPLPCRESPFASRLRKSTSAGKPPPAEAWPVTVPGEMVTTRTCLIACAAISKISGMIENALDRGKRSGRYVRFTPKEDICSATADVRFVPIADIAFLFDDFIGGRDQRPGYFKTKRLCGFEIDPQFKLGR